MLLLGVSVFTVSFSSPVPSPVPQPLVPSITGLMGPLLSLLTIGTGGIGGAAAGGGAAVGGAAAGGAAAGGAAAGGAVAGTAGAGGAAIAPVVTGTVGMAAAPAAMMTALAPLLPGIGLGLLKGMFLGKYSIMIQIIFTNLSRS